MRNIEDVVAEVFVNQSKVVECLLDKGVFSLNDIDNLESNKTSEVQEWWAVSQHLAFQLRQIGAVVLENEFGTWWGRREIGMHLNQDDELIRLSEATAWV